jgi:hypothetical protein
MMKTLLLTSSALILAVNLTAAQAQTAAPQAPPAQNTTRTGPAPVGIAPAMAPARSARTTMIQGAPASMEKISTGVPLSPYQRMRISQSLASERGKAISVAFPLTAGSPVPKAIRLESLPPEAVAVVREFSGKSYFVTPDSLVVVNPRSREIISAFSFTDQETALVPAPAVTEKIVTLSPTERQTILREVAPGSSAGPNAIVRPKVASVGDVVPGSVALEEFPSTVSTNVPQLKTMRFYRFGQEVVIVDPDKRRVIDVIQ